jgi:hypothetical protein
MMLITQIAMEQQQAARRDVCRCCKLRLAHRHRNRDNREHRVAARVREAQTSPDQRALSGVPGQNISNTDVETAAQNQGNSMAASMA